jgi:hypothetical protein
MEELYPKNNLKLIGKKDSNDFGPSKILVKRQTNKYLEKLGIFLDNIFMINML